MNTKTQREVVWIAVEVNHQTLKKDLAEIADEILWSIRGIKDREGHTEGGSGTTRSGAEYDYQVELDAKRANLVALLDGEVL